jgi:hypothetical protein
MYMWLYWLFSKYCFNCIWNKNILKKKERRGGNGHASQKDGVPRSTKHIGCLSNYTEFGIPGISSNIRLDVVVNTYNPSTWEAKAGGSWGWGQSCETLWSRKKWNRKIARDKVGEMEKAILQVNLCGVLLLLLFIHLFLLLGFELRADHYVITTT